MNEKDKKLIKDEIEIRLKYVLPYWTSEDLDEYLYIVKQEDLDRAVLSLTDLVCNFITHYDTN